jgi:hypothetical protein
MVGFYLTNRYAISTSTCQEVAELLYPVFHFEAFNQSHNYLSRIIDYGPPPGLLKQLLSYTYAYCIQQSTLFSPKSKLKLVHNQLASARASSQLPQILSCAHLLSQNIINMLSATIYNVEPKAPFTTPETVFCTFSTILSPLSVNFPRSIWGLSNTCTSKLDHGFANLLAGKKTQH